MGSQRRNKRIFTKTSGKKAGEYYAGSAYWEWILNHGDHTGKKDKFNEPPQANPDSLSEEGSLLELYKDQKEIRDRKENLKYLMKIAVHNCGLADQEMVVVQKIIYDGVPATEVSKQLKITKQAVSDAMNRAIKKIQKKVKILTLQYGI